MIALLFAAAAHAGPREDLIGRWRSDPTLQKRITRRVWVSGSRMWIWVEGIGFHEYFERIP